jgi:hypothetical protein
MKAVLALLFMFTVTAGAWITLIVRPLLPFAPLPRRGGIEARLDRADTPTVQWVRGIVRYIDPATCTVLLQTEEGTLELFAPPGVLLGLSEGEMVSAYVAADELATTVTI